MQRRLACPWCGELLAVTLPRRGQAVYLCGTCKRYVGVLADGTVFRLEGLGDLKPKEVCP